MEKAAGLIPAERHQRIHELIRAKGTVRVSVLSDLFCVSELTVRRDLEHLERCGILERTHGGAIYTPVIRLEPRFIEKDRLHRSEKQLIGAAAANLIEDGETVFINSGSTTLQIFPNLAGKKNVRIITSNLGALENIRGSDFELIFVGGIYRDQSNSLVGSMTRSNIQQFNASKCFIGVDGVSLKYGLTTPAMQEAEVARTMIEHTHIQRIVVADHSKFGKVAEVLTASLKQIDVLIVDAGLDESIRQDFEEAGIKVIIAK